MPHRVASSAPGPSAQKAVDPAVEQALEKLKGRWVAVLGSEVVAVGESPSEVIQAALRRGVTDPTVFQVPTHPDHVSYY